MYVDAFYVRLLIRSFVSGLITERKIIDTLAYFFFSEKGVDISSDKLQRGPHKKTKLQTSPTVKRPRRRHPSAVGGAPLLLLP
jgi:hypothetical protein